MSVITATRFTVRAPSVGVDGRASSAAPSVVEQFADMVVDLVTDPAHDLQRLPRGIGDLPVQYLLAGYTGHASPQPSVTTTSAARTTSSVSGLGNSIAHIDAELAHRLHHDRVDLLVGMRARRADPDPTVRQVMSERGGHLAATRVALTHEQHLRQRLGDKSRRPARPPTAARARTAR